MNIEVKNIKKVYSNHKLALSDININIDEPAFIGLLGQKTAVLPGALKD